MEHTTKRHSLNKNQIHLLKLIYKFRFATSLLIARYKEAGSIRSTNTSLTTLVESGHLDRRFTSEYNLLHKPAEYFLTTKAIKLLSTKEPNLNKLSLTRMRANNSVGELFINRQLLAFEA